MKEEEDAAARRFCTGIHLAGAAARTLQDFGPVSPGGVHSAVSASSVDNDDLFQAMSPLSFHTLDGPGNRHFFILR